MKILVGFLFVCILNAFVSGKSLLDEDNKDTRRLLIERLKSLLQEEKRLNEEKEKRNNEATTVGTQNTKAEELMNKLGSVFKDFDTTTACGVSPPPPLNTQTQQPGDFPPPIKAHEIDATLQKVINFMTKAGDQIAGHQRTAMDLENELKNNESALNDITHDHFKLGHDLVHGFLDISTEGICAFGQLFPLIMRMNLFGIENVPACNGMINALMEHAKENGMNVYSAFCNLGYLLPRLSEGLREDIHCLTQDVHSTLDSFTKIQDAIKHNANQHSDIMALFSAATFRALRSGEDSMKMMGAVVSASHYVDEYMKMQASNTLNAACSQYWSTNGKKELDMELLRNVKELLQKIQQRAQM